ncbi:MAG: radical SAM protein [Candidatus Wallbacteria bacterium]|nr:radical SAM protein [Candidatus Wallbacteria bacterium]
MIPDGRFPKNVMIQTTTACNAACTFCPHPQIKEEVSQGDMDEALFRKIVDELATHAPILRILMYLMNEPLLDPRLAERIDYAKERNPKATVHLLTNGVLLGKMGEKLLRSNLDWIGLSVHALKEETYHKLMGLTHFEGERGIKRILEDFCVKAVEQKGAEYVNVKIIRDKRYLEQQEAQDAVRFWRDLGLTRVEYYEEPMTRAGNVRWLPPVAHSGIEGCNSIWAMEMVHILYNGDVIACCNDWRRDLVFGNVREQSIEEVWNGPIRRQFLREVYGEIRPRPGLICLKCEAAQPATRTPPWLESESQSVPIPLISAEAPVSVKESGCCSSGADAPATSESSCCSSGNSPEASSCCTPEPPVSGQLTASPLILSRPPAHPEQAAEAAVSKDHVEGQPTPSPRAGIVRGNASPLKRIQAPAPATPAPARVAVPEPRPIALCPFPAKPPQERAPHHLVALEGGPPAVLLVALPPGNAKGPPAQVTYLTAALLARKVRAFAYDYNLASFLSAASSVQARWHEYADSGYNVPETSAAVARVFSNYAVKAGKEIADLAPEALALHVPPAALRAAIELTARLREARFEAPIYWYGPGVRKEMDRQLPPGGTPTAFIVGDPERTLMALAGGVQHPPGVWRTGSTRFTPATPVQSFGTQRLGDAGPFHFAGYAAPQVELAMGRGCVERCPHCPRAPHGLLLRTRDVSEVYLEMERLHREKGVTDFFLGETMANCQPEQLTALASMIRDSGLPVTWEARYLASPGEGRDHYRLLWDGGCRRLRFCLPTTATGYRFDAHLIESLRHSHWASIRTALDTVVVGLPGSPDDSFDELCRFLWEAAEYVDEIETLSDLLLLPGCELDASMEQFGIARMGKDLARDWHDNGFLNREFRRKRLKELYLFLEDKRIKLPSRERVFGMSGPLLEAEPVVRKRLNTRAGRPADCVLATCPPWGYTDPPVALAYLSSYLRERGYRCEVHDYNTQLYLESPQDMKLMWHVENKNYWSSGDTFPILKGYYLDKLEKWADEIAGSAAPVVGLSVVDPKERMTIELIRRIKVRDASKHIILGGPAVYTPDFRQIFVDQVGELVDGYVIGEGEATLRDIIDAVKAGTPISEVPGVVTYPDGVHPHELFRSSISPLDSVPFPDYKDFDLARYPSKKLILEWSRGCVNRCAFCKGVAITGKWRNRTPAHIVEELTYHYRKNGISEFEISDQLVNGDIAQLEEVCDRITRAKLDIRWMCQGLPRPQMTRRVFDKLKAAGCYDFKFGLESASDKVIRLMGKGASFTRADAARVMRDCFEAGIEVSTFVIVGYPGEEEEDFVDTYDFFKDNHAFITRIKSINALAIITDTPIHRHAEQFNVVLPPVHYHYLWRTRDGRNTLEVRRDRIRRLLALAKETGLQVMETNLTEGKQDALAERIAKDGLSFRQAIDLMKEQTNRLGSFDTEKPSEGAGDDAWVVQRVQEVVEENQSGALPPRPHLIADSGTLGSFQPHSSSLTPQASSLEPHSSSLEPQASSLTPQASFDLEALGVMDGRRAFKGPKILEIDMTNDCNLSCAGCWCHSHLMGDRRFSGAFKRHFMPLDTIRRLIDDAAAMGTKRVQLAGSGEPFMHPQIWEVIRHVKSKGLELAIITNFTLITEQGVKDLVTLGVDDLTVSVWAGTQEAYERTHPGTDGEAMMRLERLLVLLQGTKGSQRAPRVKLYNVVSNLNADDVDAMVEFALRTGAQYCEFTPVDTIEGYTDCLRLSHEQSEEVLAAFERLQGRSDYVNMLGIEHLEVMQNVQHTAEAAEFPSRLMKESVHEGFNFHIEHRHTRATCPAGLDSSHVYSDPQNATGYVFLFDEERCKKCPLHDGCSIDKQNYSVKREFLSILGFGSFSRRLHGEVEKGEYEKSFVDSMPCYIGWTYSRVTTDGNVIPCCKGYGKPLGNLEQAEGGFAAVWNSPNLQNFRQLASTQKKDHPYFNPINCVKCCDNVGMNLAMHRKVMALSTDERARLAGLYGQSGAQQTRARLLPDDTSSFPDPFAASELVGHSEVRAAQRNNSASEPDNGETPADDAGSGDAEGYASDSPTAPVLDPDAADRIALRFK